jgi:ketosteroid isomerase-like protein
VAPAASLKGQLEEVLAGIREANLKQDLTQLLNFYAPDFLHLKEKAQSISKSWQAYDYLDMEFRVEEVKSLEPDRASARITWNIKTRNRKTGSLKNVTKAYRVWFTKDSDQWRVDALENLPPRPREKP